MCGARKLSKAEGPLSEWCQGPDDHRSTRGSDPLSVLVPGERIEPPTNGLQNRCSTAELTRLKERATSVTDLPQAM